MVSRDDRRPHRDDIEIDPFYSSTENRKAAYARREPSGLRLSHNRKAAYVREPSGLRISEVQLQERQQEQQQHDDHLRDEHSYGERDERQGVCETRDGAPSDDNNINVDNEWSAEDGPIRFSISNDRSVYTSTSTSRRSSRSRVSTLGQSQSISNSITDSNLANDDNDENESASRGYVINSNNIKSSSVACGVGKSKSSSLSRAGHTAATPRVANTNLPKNLRIRTDTTDHSHHHHHPSNQQQQQQHQYETDLASLPEDREAIAKKDTKPFNNKSRRVRSKDFLINKPSKPSVPDTPTSYTAVNEDGLNNIEKNKQLMKPPARIRSRESTSSWNRKRNSAAASGNNSNSKSEGGDEKEEQYHHQHDQYPMPSTTPKSHVAHDDDGMNNIEQKVEEDDEYNTYENDSKSKSILSKRVSSLKKKYLPTAYHKSSTVSDVTGGGEDHTATADEVDYGIDPSRGSFDLVIVPKGSGGSGNGNGGHNHHHHHQSNHRHHRHHRERERRHTKQTAATRRVKGLSVHEPGDYADETSTSIASASIANDTYTAKSLTYWSSLSVRAAMAVMSAKGSEVVAQKAANVVLEEGKTKHHPTQHDYDLQELATKVSVVVLEAGGDHKVAAAVAVAIMNEEKKNNMVKQNKKKKMVPQFTMGRKGKQRCAASKEAEYESDGSRSNQSESSNDDDIMRMSSLQRRSRVRQREGEIDKRNRALELSCLEKESRANHQKEKAIKHRMSSLEADLATDKMAATLAAKKAIQDSESKRKAAQQKKNQAASSTVSRNDEALKQKEEEIERRNRALQERAKTLLRAEQEIDERNKAQSERKKAQAKASSIIMNFGKNFSTSQGKRNTGSEKERDQEEEDIASITASMVSKRRILEQKESEIAARNKALQDAHQLNLAKEAEIQKRMAALDAATTAVDNKEKQRGLSKKEEAKRRELKEKEEAIAHQNAQLVEASRLNAMKEREITERMAGLDAATAALLERANNVQQEINRRSRSSGSRSGGVTQNGGHAPLDRVDEEQSYHNSHQGNGPAVHDGQQRQHQYPEPPQQHSTYQDSPESPHQYSTYQNGPTNYNTGPGEFSVATPSNMMHHQHQHPLSPPPIGFNNNDAIPNSNDPSHTQPPPLHQSKSKGMFEQLTSKLYSVLDGACDSAATGYLAQSKMSKDQDTATHNSPASNYSPDTYATGNPNGPSSYHNGARANSPRRGGIMPFPYEPEPEPEPSQRFKTSTMSGLTDDYNRSQSWKSWKHSDGQRQMMDTRDDEMNAALKDALNQTMYQHQHRPQNPRQPGLENGPNQLLNDALNQTMNQQQGDHNKHNKPSIQQSSEPPSKSSSPNLATNKALNDALNQAMFQQQNNGRMPKDSRNGDPTPLLKQPRYNNSAIVEKPNNPKSSLTKKLKSGLLSSFNKKTTTATLNQEGKVQMKMKSKQNDSMRTLAVKKFAPTRKSTNKANVMPSRRRPPNGNTNSGAAKKSGQGQVFSFSKQRSKLEEI